MDYKHKTSLLINELTDIDQWDAIEHIQELAQHVAILQSNIAQLEKDAARYRWLCNRNGYFMEENYLSGVHHTKQEIDVVIDEAMKGG